MKSFFHNLLPRKQESKKEKEIQEVFFYFFAAHFIKHTFLKSCKPQSNSTCLL